MTNEDVNRFIDRYIPDLTKKERAYCKERVKNLSEEDIDDFFKSMEACRLTDDMNQKLRSCPTEKMRNSYLDYFHRFMNFHKKDWLEYLCGELSYKPEAYSFRQ